MRVRGLPFDFSQIPSREIVLPLLDDRFQPRPVWILESFGNLFRKIIPLFVVHAFLQRSLPRDRHVVFAGGCPVLARIGGDLKGSLRVGPSVWLKLRRLFGKFMNGMEKDFLRRASAARRAPTFPSRERREACF